MTIVRFERVKATGYKTVKCAGCPKKLRRQKTVTRTINPFNLNRDGIPKARIEIMDDNDRELSAWREQPEYCDDCSTRIELAFWRRDEQQLADEEAAIERAHAGLQEHQDDWGPDRYP